MHSKATHFFSSVSSFGFELSFLSVCLSLRFRTPSSCLLSFCPFLCLFFPSSPSSLSLSLFPPSLSSILPSFPSLFRGPRRPCIPMEEGRKAIDPEGTREGPESERERELIKKGAALFDWNTENRRHQKEVEPTDLGEEHKPEKFYGHLRARVSECCDFGQTKLVHVGTFFSLEEHSVV